VSADRSNSQTARGARAVSADGADGAEPARVREPNALSPEAEEWHFALVLALLLLIGSNLAHAAIALAGWLSLLGLSAGLRAARLTDGPRLLLVTSAGFAGGLALGASPILVEPGALMLLGALGLLLEARAQHGRPKLWSTRLADGCAIALPVLLIAALRQWFGSGVALAPQLAGPALGGSADLLQHPASALVIAAVVLMLRRFLVQRAAGRKQPP